MDLWESCSFDFSSSLLAWFSAAVCVLIFCLEFFEEVISWGLELSADFLSMLHCGGTQDERDLSCREIQL